VSRRRQIAACNPRTKREVAPFAESSGRHHDIGAERWHDQAHVEDRSSAVSP
jgi:hypothetical protein